MLRQRNLIITKPDMQYIRLLYWRAVPVVVGCLIKTENSAGAVEIKFHKFERIFLVCKSVFFTAERRHSEHSSAPEKPHGKPHLLHIFPVNHIKLFPINEYPIRRSLTCPYWFIPIIPNSVWIELHAATRKKRESHSGPCWAQHSEHSKQSIVISYSMYI